MSVSVVATREAMFSVHGHRAAPLFYQWRHNGAPLPNANNSTLLLTNLQLSRRRQLHRTGLNENGSRRKRRRHAHRARARHILTQPTNRFVKIRPDPNSAPQTNVTFVIVATSTTPIRYQWRFNGADIPGATEHQLHRHQRATQPRGRLRSASLTDGAGTIFSAAAYLQPLITPVIVRHPASQESWREAR